MADAPARMVLLFEGFRLDLGRCRLGQNRPDGNGGVSRLTAPAPR
jgi:hypothetical protein